MKDNSDLIPAGKVTGLAPTSQAIDTVTSRAGAMTAQGSVPAVDVLPSRANPPGPVIEEFSDANAHNYVGLVPDPTGGGSVEGDWSHAGDGLDTGPWRDLTK